MQSSMQNRKHELFSAISRVRYRPTLNKTSLVKTSWWFSSQCGGKNNIVVQCLYRFIKMIYFSN